MSKKLPQVAGTRSTGDWQSWEASSFAGFGLEQRPPPRLEMRPDCAVLFASFYCPGCIPVTAVSLCPSGGN